MSPPSSLPRWLLAVLLVLAAGGVGLVGTSWLARPLDQASELYYADAQAMYLVPVRGVTALPPTREASPWANALFERLRRAPAPDLVAAVPAEVTLASALWTAPVWRLVLGLPNGFGSSAENLLVGSVVRSFLASYPGAEKVEVRLLGPDAKTFESQHLDLGQPFDRNAFANTPGDEPPGGPAVTLWWALPAADWLVPVRVTLASGSGSLVQDTLARWAAGPPGPAKAYLRGIPGPKTPPHLVGLVDGVARIELAAAPPAGAAGERYVRALALTLTGLPAVTAVQLLRAGQPIGTALGPFQLHGPIGRPDAVNVAPAAQAATRPSAF